MSTNGSADASLEDLEDESLAIVEELQLGGEKKLKVVSIADDQIHGQSCHSGSV